MYLLKKILFIIICTVGTIAPSAFLIMHNIPSNSDCFKFPLVVSTSGIVLENLQKYDGTYFEDLSEEQVNGIAAGIFTNTGSQCIESAYIEIFLQNNKYTFEICMLPPGMRVLVLDAHKTAYSGNIITDFRVNSTVCEYEFNDKVNVKVIDDNFYLINNEGEALSFSVYHRLWRKHDNMYCGGIAYKTYIKDLEPSDILCLKSGFTFPDHSKIIYIE